MAAVKDIGSWLGRLWTDAVCPRLRKRAAIHLDRISSASRFIYLRHSLPAPYVLLAQACAPVSFFFLLLHNTFLAAFVNPQLPASLGLLPRKAATNPDHTLFI